MQSGCATTAPYPPVGERKYSALVHGQDKSEPNRGSRCTPTACQGAPHIFTSSCPVGCSTCAVARKSTISLDTVLQECGGGKRLPQGRGKVLSLAFLLLSACSWQSIPGRDWYKGSPMRSSGPHFLFLATCSTASLLKYSHSHGRMKSMFACVSDASQPVEDAGQGECMPALSNGTRSRRQIFPGRVDPLNLKINHTAAAPRRGKSPTNRKSLLLNEKRVPSIVPFSLPSHSLTSRWSRLCLYIRNG